MAAEAIEGLPYPDAQGKVLSLNPAMGAAKASTQIPEHSRHAAVLARHTVGRCCTKPLRKCCEGMAAVYLT